MFSNSTVEIPNPRIVYCVLLKHQDSLKEIIVSKGSFFEVDQDSSQISFLEFMNYLDGENSIEEISKKTSLNLNEVCSRLNILQENNLIVQEKQLTLIDNKILSTNIYHAIHMWRMHMATHDIFTSLLAEKNSKNVLVGLIIESYHFVLSTTKHIQTAINNTESPFLKKLLSKYLCQESGHEKYFLHTLSRLGFTEESIKHAAPISGTVALNNYLNNIAQTHTLGYIGCISLYEINEWECSNIDNVWKSIAKHNKINVKHIEPIIEHMKLDCDSKHSSLFNTASNHKKIYSLNHANEILNIIHGLKHAFDDYNQQILDYYSKGNCKIPHKSLAFSDL
jgi:hypothetical protein